MLEKIEESLRPPCMVKNLNVDEVMELCILSCEITATQSVEVCVMCDEVGTP